MGLSDPRLSGPKSQRPYSLSVKVLPGSMQCSQVGGVMTSKREAELRPATDGIFTGRPSGDSLRFTTPNEEKTGENRRTNEQIHETLAVETIFSFALFVLVLFGLFGYADL